MLMYYTLLIIIFFRFPNNFFFSPSSLLLILLSIYLSESVENSLALSSNARRTFTPNTASHAMSTPSFIWAAKASSNSWRNDSDTCWDSDVDSSFSLLSFPSTSFPSMRSFGHTMLGLYKWSAVQLYGDKARWKGVWS